MPIPRKIQDEFFIPGINILHHEDTTNQAVIYQPYEPIHVQIIETGRNIENLEVSVSQIDDIFGYMGDFFSHAIDLFDDFEISVSQTNDIFYDIGDSVSQENDIFDDIGDSVSQTNDIFVDIGNFTSHINDMFDDIGNFTSHINDIFDDITRIDPNNDNFHLTILNISLKMFLGRYLNRFLISNASDNITSLTYKLYLDIQNNSDLLNNLGNTKTNLLKRAVYKYYKDLLEKKQNQKRKKENFDIQFKEFKIHQNYTEKRKYKEIRNINVKKYQHYLRILTRKNRNKVFCNHFAFSYFLYDVNNVNSQYQNHIFEEQR